MRELMPDCVIAAAGGSSRMGSPKLLLPFGGRTMIGTVVASALEAGCRVVLVVGCRGAEVAQAARRAASGESVEAADNDNRLVVAENPAWEAGMLGSIQAGLGLVRSAAFFAMNGDMPLVPATAYRLLARERAARERSGLADAAFFASSGGRPGHPVLVPSAWIPEILELGRDDRMKRFLDGRPCVLVEAGTQAVLADIDTPEEYRKTIEPGDRH